MNERLDLPQYMSPIDPVKLNLDDVIQFRCHKQISCFNVCCKNSDLQLTPYDILRLKRHLGLDSAEFVARYTTPYPMDYHDLPGLKMNTKPGTAECVFLAEEGCTVYADRPVACRYYALGTMGMRKKDNSNVENIYFIVKEDHCRGHDEPCRLSVAEYRQEQGIEIYDAMNELWQELILKKRSSGPTVGQPTARSIQLFDMCSYDIDSFRRFVQTPGFLENFDLAEEEIIELVHNEDQLLQFSMRFLNQVLFGVMTIPMKPDARQKRLTKLRSRSPELQEDLESVHHQKSRN